MTSLALLLHTGTVPPIVVDSYPISLYTSPLLIPIFHEAESSSHIGTVKYHLRRLTAAKDQSPYVKFLIPKPPTTFVCPLSPFVPSSIFRLLVVYL